MARLCLASCAELCASPTLASATFGTSGCDEQALYDALTAAGTPFDVRAWDDGTVDWASYAAVVVRTTWDYSSSEARAGAFRAWLLRVEAAGVLVMNSPATLAWNAHKSYLRELGARGVPVIPTEYISAGSAPGECDLAAISARRGWGGGALFLKPCVSGGSRGCLRVDGAAVTLATGSAFLHRMVTTGAEQEEEVAAAVAAGGAGAAPAPPSGTAPSDGCDMMLQPYLNSVEVRGELSVVTVGGRITHALVKMPRVGDFKTQEEWGGTPTRTPVTPRMVAAVEAVLAAAGACVPLRAGPSELLLARIDFLLGGDDGAALEEAPLVLLEFEAIEPCLFFAQSREGAPLEHPDHRVEAAQLAPAAVALAAAIAERLPAALVARAQ